MEYRFKQRILDRRISKDLKTFKEMLNIHTHPRNANQTTLRYLTPIRMAKIKNTDDSLCWRGCGVKRTLLRWYSCCGNQYGDFSENQTSAYLKTQQSLQGIYHTTRTFAQLCSQQHYSQETESGTNLDALQPKKWIKKMWSIYTMEYYLPV